MRSKRKQVNKYSHKQTDDMKESELELQLRRNTGIKPFQLTKLRQTHRHINDSPVPNNELLHRRTGSNHFFNDLNEVNLDLIIKQKLIIDAQFNQKLESERKNLIYLDNARDNYEKVSPPCGYQDEIALLHDKSEEEELIEDRALSNFEQKRIEAVFSNQNQQPPQQLQALTEGMKEKAESSLKQHTFGQQKVHQEYDEPGIVAEELSNNQNIQEIIKMEIKLLKQKSHPPFSFTSAKWRSKSEILQIDKWKEKYNREAPSLIKQIEKQILTERYKRSQTRTNQVMEQKNPIHSQEKQKISLPTLQKMREMDQSNSIVKLTTKKSHQKEAKSLFRIDSHPEIKTHRSLQLVAQKQTETRGKRPQESIEQKVEIIIKKMYESQLEKYEETAVSQADYVHSAEQQEGSDPADGKRKKKSKFPEIQISTFTSTKELETQKKKEKLDQIQRLAKQWRFVAPKKVYISKVMEEIPQRWQYGESRESSRQEVDDYLLVKQQEKREYEKVKSQQMEAQLGDTRAKEVGFPSMESRLTND